MCRIENYLYDLKEELHFEIPEELENNLIKKYAHHVDSEEADLKMRQSALNDIHVYYSNKFKEEAAHFYSTCEELIDEHQQAMIILKRLGLTHFLNFSEFTEIR